MKYMVKSHLECYATSANLFLEGQLIYLAYDGKKTYESTDYVQVNDGKLDVTLQVKGLNGTAWSLKIVVKQDDDPTYKMEYEKSGEIVKNQWCQHMDTISL